jgi:hypothetical protein
MIRKVGFWAERAPRGNVDLTSLLGPLVSRALGVTPYPPVERFIDLAWNPRERAAVLAYVRNGRVCESYFGWSDCRLCGAENGSRDLTDGTYVWPEGFGHYIEKHAVKPPSDFVHHVLRQRGLR